jgi:hypothetical protein
MVICSQLFPIWGTGTKTWQLIRIGIFETWLVTGIKKGTSRLFLVVPMVAGVGFEPTTSGL